MRGGDVSHKQDLESPFPTGVTLTLLREGLDEMFACPVESDNSTAHVCILGSGPDRVGHVAKMARVISDAGGNVTHSKMIRLGQEFDIMMHVSVDHDKRGALIDRLQHSDDLKLLNIRASSLRRRKTGSYKNTVVGLKIHVVGKDKPGMLATISEAIAQRGLSIEDVTTEIRRGRTSKRDFVVTADVVATEMLEREHLDSILAEFQSLKDDLDLSVVDIRVHMGDSPAELS